MTDQKVQIGETVHSAIWLDGCETDEMVSQYKADVEQAIADLCRDSGVIAGPVKFSYKYPHEDGVPEVPDHVQGLAVRMLVGEADVVGKAPELKMNSFLGDLEKKDLERLRVIVRRQSPGLITDKECDAIIEEVGPDAAYDAVRRAVDGGYLH